MAQQPKTLTDAEKLEILNNSIFILYQRGNEMAATMRIGVAPDAFIEMLFRSLFMQTAIGAADRTAMANAVKKALPTFLSALGIKDERDEIIEKQKQTIESLEYAITKLNEGGRK